MIKFMGIEIGGVEIIKVSLLTQAFFFTIILILALHYGILFFVRAFKGMRAERKWLEFVLTVVCLMIVAAIFSYFIKTDWLYRVLSYVILIIYGALILSRGFVGWYVKTDDITKKLDRILSILEKDQK